MQCPFSFRAKPRPHCNTASLVSHTALSSNVVRKLVTNRVWVILGESYDEKHLNGWDNSGTLLFNIIVLF